MDEADREVLEFIGDQGKTAEQVSDRFPAFDLVHLVRAELARPRRTKPGQVAVAPHSAGGRAHVLRARRAEPSNRPRFAHASLRL